VSAVVVNTAIFGCGGGRKCWRGVVGGNVEGGWELVLIFAITLVFIKLNIGLCMSVYVSLICKLSLLSFYMWNRSYVFIN
jgi:hypothetical protein